MRMRQRLVAVIRNRARWPQVGQRHQPGSLCPFGRCRKECQQRESAYLASRCECYQDLVSRLTYFVGSVDGSLDRSRMWIDLLQRLPAVAGLGD